jgi:phage anti-repressor protein
LPRARADVREQARIVFSVLKWWDAIGAKGGMPGRPAPHEKGRQSISNASCVLHSQKLPIIFLQKMDLTAAILAHPGVVATGLHLHSRTDLAKVFINAFDIGGKMYSIDIDDVWEFCSYSTKGNGLRKLKGSQFQYDTNYIQVDEYGVIIWVSQSDKVSGALNKYYLNENAFKNFAMCAPGEHGRSVRGFFIAVKDAHLAQTRDQDPIGQKEKAMLLLHDNKKCIYVGAGQQQPTKLFKFGWTTSIGRRYKEHKAAFKEPMFFELLHVVETEDDRKAEELFRNMGDIKDNMSRLMVGDITHTEMFAAPPSLTEERIIYNMRKAARQSTSLEVVMLNAHDNTLS